MNPTDLKEKLLQLSEIEERIATEVRAVYDSYNKLTVELIPEFIKRSKEEIAGLLTSPITIKFKDGKAWTLKPAYVKDGAMSNVCFKVLGVNPFTITQNKGKSDKAH